MNTKRYKKVLDIGSGSYSTVYVAIDQRSSIYKTIEKDTPLVALKEMKKFDKWNEEGVLFSTLREIKILKEIDHPNIIKMHDLLIDEGRQITLVLELLVCNLSDLMERSLDDNDKKCIIYQILRGMDRVHSSWIIHRDMKPENILFSEDGLVKIADFGLSRTFGAINQLFTKNLFTLHYRPPEVLFGSDKYGPLSDMWAVGCIIAELYLGFRRLFPGQTEIDQLAQIFSIRGTPNKENWPGCETLPDFVCFEKCDGIPLNKVLKNAPPEIIELIDGMLKLDPSRRTSAKAALASKYLEGAEYLVGKCKYQMIINERNEMCRRSYAEKLGKN